MRAVNLLPPEHTLPKSTLRLASLRRRFLVPGAALALLGALGGLTVAVMHANSGLSIKQQQLNALQSKISRLPATPTLSPSAQATASSTAPRRSTIIALDGARMPWDEFLQAFSRVVPEDVWFSALQANSPGAAVAVQASQQAAAAETTATTSTAATTTTTTTTTPAATSSSASTFTVTGFTYSEPEVARLMRRLALVPWLTDVSLVSTSNTTVGKSTVVQFTLGATVVGAPTSTTGTGS